MKNQVSPPVLMDRRHRLSLSRALDFAAIRTTAGLVVVGDLIGSGEAHERGIVGETPNLAAENIIRHANDPLQSSIERAEQWFFHGDRCPAASWPARIIATDKETGRVVWQTNVTFDQPELRITGAPLAIKDKLIIGASGGDSGVRDWVAGLDAATGKVLWRKFTIPAPGEPGSETWKDKNNAWQTGGAAVWVTGTYDPDTNQTIWGIGGIVRGLIGDTGIGLDVLSRIIIDWLAGLLVDALGPVDVHVGLRQDGLAVVAPATPSRCSIQLIGPVTTSIQTVRSRGTPTRER
jgi:hypothetical protein